MKFVMYSIIVILALLAGGLAGYLVFASPVWLFGQKPEAMILFGWFSSVAGIVVFCLVAPAIFFGLSLLVPKA